MRLWLLPTSLLLGSISVLASQFILSPQPSSMTIVDALNADPDYTVLLQLLQRARLIPTLNRLSAGCTFFAPVNDAWHKHKFWRHYIDSSDDPAIVDNIHEQLRQLLFYHLVNYTFPTPPQHQNPLVLNTLLYPHESLPPPSHDPPPYPPWTPIKNGTLGKEPQRVRLASTDDSAYVGVDAFGNGGVEIIKGRADVGNSTLFGLSKVLEPPVSLAEVLSEHSELSYFKQITAGSPLEFLNSTPELTVFLPTNEAWSVLHPVERLFLESEFSEQEVQRILSLHAVQNRIAWSDSFYPAFNLTTIHGSSLEIVVTPERTLVSSATLLEPDIYSSNGVIHLVSSLLLADHHLKLTPEKYLLALNCTTFVSLIHSSNLTQLVNDTEKEYTILAPKDNILALLQSLGPDDDLPEPGSPSMKAMLSYHFLPGKWLPKSLKNGMLLETALHEPGLQGDRQVIPVQVKSESSDAPEAPLSIKFGGSGTIGEHVEIGNTVIYFINKLMSPPSDALETALPRLNLSSFLAAVFSTSLAHILKTSPLTSILIPNNDAFGDRLGGLVTSHLLSGSGKSDLKKVILHHTVDGVHYKDSFRKSGKHSFPTLEGSDIQMVSVEEEKSNLTWLVAPSGGWKGLQSTLTPSNLVTRTGVIHEVSDLLLPRSVDISLVKLMKAANGNTMVRLLDSAGYGWILNGTAPPPDSPWEDIKGASWVLLCPDDDAFSEPSSKAFQESPEQLREMIEQHLIPVPGASLDSAQSVPESNRPLIFDSTPTYSTIRSSDSSYGDIVIKSDDDSTGYIIGIKDARGTDGANDWARIVSWGRVSESMGQGGGVVQIDRVLLPYHPPWWLSVGIPVIVGIIGSIAISLFYLGILKLWKREPEATYEPLGGFGHDDE